LLASVNGRRRWDRGGYHGNLPGQAEASFGKFNPRE